MTITSEDTTFAVLRNLLRRPQSDPFPEFIGTFMARDALSLAATYAGLTRDDVVLLPAYLCREVLRPFVGRTQIRFYDVADDLTVEPEAVRQALAQHRVRMLVFINYFGFLQSQRAELVRLCEENGVTLLEDCAHSLLTEGSGETGHLSVVSFRKLLPVFDGGGLRISARRPGFTVDYQPRLYSNMLSLLATAKALSRIKSDALSRAGVADRRAATTASARQAPSARVLARSWFSANGSGNAPLAHIARCRRADYEFWANLVASSPDLAPVMPRLGGGVCPLGFPVVSRRRDGLKAQFEEAGIPVRVHWTLPADAERDCPNSRRLSRQMMTLPLYPELGPALKQRAAGIVHRGARE